MTSILNDTKKMLGLAEDYNPFDLDVLTHINAVLSIVTQLGVGPPRGLVVEDETTQWESFLPLDDPRFNAVKTYVYLRVRLLFDPPTTSYLITAMEQQVQELTWRINVAREEEAWILPTI